MQARSRMLPLQLTTHSACFDGAGQAAAGLAHSRLDPLVALDIDSSVRLAQLNELVRCSSATR